MSLNQSITSSGGAQSEAEALPARHAEMRRPPVLSAEQGARLHDLKPFLKAIADVNRLAILQELSKVSSLSVLDIADRLLLSQPLTSWHLHILKRARLVSTTSQGRQHLYRINRTRLQEYKELFNLTIDM